MKKWIKITFAIIVVFLLLQFIPVDRSTPTVAENQDFIQVTQPLAPIATMLKKACYDCHSYETKYPWYANIAPASWWLQGHINEGREHLNFSTFAANNKKGKIMEECAEEVLKEKMPLNSYTWVHTEARLSSAQRQQLANWFEQNGGGEKSKPNEDND